MPIGLGPLLPGQLAASFDRTFYELDFDNFGGTSADDDMIVGVAVTTNDPKLFAKFIRYLGTQSPWFVAGSRITYMIAGPGGGF